MADDTDKTDKITIKKEWGDVARKFLELLQDDKFSGNYTVVAQAAKVNRTYVYELFHKYPDFHAQCELVKNSKDAFISDIAENELVKLITAKNITAIIFALKKYNPKKFGDQGVDPGAGPMSHTHAFSPELQSVLKGLVKKYDKSK